MTVRRTLLTVSEDDALIATGVAAKVGANGDCVSELATDGPAATMVVLRSALVRPEARRFLSLKERHLLRDQRLRG
jgi:hypothetical protein